MLSESRPQLLLALAACCAALALWLPAAAGAAVPGHGRAWELVTSAETNGVDIAGGRGWSADGDRFMFWGRGPLPGASGGEIPAHTIAVRRPEGWGVTPLSNSFTSHGLELAYPLLLATTPDLATSLWASPWPLLPEGPMNPTVGVYRRSPDGTLKLMLANGGDRDAFRFIDATQDLQHVIFQTEDHLLPADAGRAAGSGAYELIGSTLRLVGVDDTGAAFPCGATTGLGFGDDTRLHPLSADGRRIFFKAAPTCGDPARVYVREDGAQTIDLSTSRCTRPDCNAPSAVTFSGATPDGAHVLLTTSQQLTDDDTDDKQDLYVRRLSDGALRRVSEGPTGNAADVSSSVVRVSDDGQRIYFVAIGVLVPGKGEAGRANVYLNDHGTLRFVATADGVDLAAAEISADGGTLVFSTSSALVPGDLDSSDDIYRYDAVSGAFALASGGEAGRGSAALSASFQPMSFYAFPHQRMRALSDDGRVFFGTAEALLPEDHNETLDIYEYANGTLGLITSGTGTDSPYFAGVSADGRSVFFITSDSLLPTDLDRGDYDVYVARLGGGFPDPAPPVPRCSGDACQGAPTVHAVGSSVGSLTAEVEVVPPPAAPLTLRAPSAQTRRQWAATGKARITVDVPAAGRVALVARARMTGARKAVVVGRAGVTVRRAGTVHLTLGLSRAARRALKLRGSLTLTLSASHSRLGQARSLQVKLSRPAAPARKGAGR